MSHDITEETLEEGRSALYQLERQLKDRGVTSDNRSETSGSKQQSSASERRLLDQLPRIIRLNNRLESLGLTVEELDDRGLLDGGGSVPSYYTSLKQKNRRVLELQPRSHRLQERGKETLSKLLNAIFHMLRILIKKGLYLEDYFRGMDVDKKGLITKKQMLFVLKQIGLPFSYKELQDITQQYCQPSSEKVDYISFIRDGRLGKKSGNDGSTSNDSHDKGNQNARNNHNHDLSSYTAVLHEVKRMLYEAIKTLNKNFDEVYRMFTRWDTQGTGTVTATQFLRVLARLHIELSDQDQDFLVELLDTNAMGRIDFESLLSYCFNEDSPTFHASNPSQNGGIIVGTAIGFDDNGETLSAVSIDGNSVEQKSMTSGNLLKRPHTASISRPYSSNMLSSLAISNNHSHSDVPKVQLPSVQPGNFQSNNNSFGLPAQSYAFEEKKKGEKNRPSTAVGRISSNQQISSGGGGGSSSGGGSGNGANRQNQRGNVIKNHLDDDGVIDLPDDVIHGEEMYLSNNTAHANHSGHPPLEVKYNQFFADNSINNNSNTNGYNRGHNYQSEPSPIPTMNDTLLNGTQPHPSMLEEYDLLNSDPIDHLILLANQILATLRDIILTRYRRGRGLREIYQHFDRDQKGYFTSSDFITATSDLSIETSERVATIAIKQMGIDSGSYVTYGEFVVFVLDSDHGLLEGNVQDQLAALFEKQGREYQSWMIDVFYGEEESINDSRNSKSLLSPSSMPPLPNTLGGMMMNNNKRISYHQQQQGFISKNAFISSLKKIGLVITSSEITRLVDRFDIYGNEYCSVDRFIKMIQTSRAWKHAEVVLTYQDKAVHEANYLREQKNHSQQKRIIINEIEVTDELINMCEYLGICILSEQNMIWIAADALRAPLPVNWSAQKDQSGKTYFYNHLTNQSQWEHPLDPHFRNLRDKYRQGVEEAEIIDNGNNNLSARLPQLETSPGKTAVENHYHQQLFEKNVHPPPVKQTNNTEEAVLNYYRNTNNHFSVPSEIPTNHNTYNKPQQQQQEKKKDTRPASAVIPEKVTISFGNTGGGNSSNLNDTMVSGLSSTGDYQKQARPVSAPAIAKKEDSNNKSNHPAKLQTVAQNKVVMEAVYTAPYLKSAPLNNYQDTSKLPDKQYYNTHYHNLPSTSTATPMSSKREERSNNAFNSSSPPNYFPQQQSSTPSNANSNNKKKANQSSSQQPQLSIVDRALSIGKNSQQILQERDQTYPNQQVNNSSSANHLNNSKHRAAKLNEMLDGDIVGKLDYLIGSRR